MSKGLPVSAHPAFPIVVTAWFAALFGLGCLILPLPLIEKFVLLVPLGMISDDLVPPVDFLGQMKLAGLMALLGAVLGFVIARRVAALQAPAAAYAEGEEMDDFAAVQAEVQRKPISAHEELGDTGLESPAEEAEAKPPAAPGRRRPLALADEGAPSEYLDWVPLPGSEAQWDEANGDPGDEETAPAAEEVTMDTAFESEPLELGNFAEADDALASEDEGAVPADSGLDGLKNEAAPIAEIPVGDASSEIDVVQAQHAADEQPEDRQQVSEASQAQQSTQVRQTFQPAAVRQEGAYDRVASLDEISALAGGVVRVVGNKEAGFDEPIPFSPPSLARRAAQEEVAETVEPQPLAQAVAAQDNDVALGELGTLELAARLQQSIRRRREIAAQRRSEGEAAANAQAEASANFGLDAESAAADEAHEALAAFFDSAVAMPALAGVETIRTGPTPAPSYGDFSDPREPGPSEPAVPMALQPLDFGSDEDDEEGEDLPLDLSLPLARGNSAGEMPTAPAPAIAVPDHATAAAEAEEPENAHYSSLLSIKRGAALEGDFVRVDEPEPEAGAFEPSVVFPGTEARFNDNRADSAAREEVQSADIQPLRRFDRPAGSGAADDAPAEEPPAPRRPRLDPGEADRSLRQALESLQRMNGAA